MKLWVHHVLNQHGIDKAVSWYADLERGLQQVAAEGKFSAPYVLKHEIEKQLGPEYFSLSLQFVSMDDFEARTRSVSHCTWF